MSQAATLAGYERTVKIDLLHVIRLEPLEATVPPGNGQT